MVSNADSITMRSMDLDCRKRLYTRTAGNGKWIALRDEA
ncbi:hypothetical protein CEV34_4258 [Brucella pseudogrignonensis]|uniref:Uncharacterized protein n=1 Tax=Brucella pseudogrignonensis TaxID=419475 RepID=A0A256G645_9HYPH|nr:hypothetical protein CEV34_4258 [Brucella pseudogrignonensis]